MSGLTPMSENRKSPKSASIIIVGNEILSGRTLDTNSHWIAKRLHRLGVHVRHIATIPDDEDKIAQTVRDSSLEHDYVIVTGGIGPTPDDVTRRAVALAFDRELTTNAEAERIIRKRYGEKTNSYRLEMARLPEGSELLRNHSFAAPGFQIENVFVFPGVPQLMQEMFDQIIPSLETAEFFERKIPAHLPESEFAQILYSTPDRENVSIGSYPAMQEDGSWTVTIVVSGCCEDVVDDVAGRLESQLRQLERSKGIHEPS